MTSKFIKTFEERMAFYILVSAAATTVFEFALGFVIHQVSEQLRYSGYRSVLMGPDGLNPGARWGVMLFLGLLIFVICFYGLIRRYMKYVRIITDGIRDIAQGNFDKEIPVRSLDEFGQIAGYLNQMEANIKVIMERERLAEHTKNDLISSVAHDLRTPLTSIIGYLGWVREQEELDAETRKKYLDIAYRKARHLEQMTNDLFGFVKLEHREMPLHMGTLDIVQLMAQMMDENAPAFEQNCLTAEFSCPQKSIQMTADGNLLARLFENLLNNAVKYGKDGKMIRVEMEQKEENVVTRVINYGYVIPPEELEKLFRKFYRVDHSRSQNTGGTGLGLAIVEQIAQLHGGSVSVRSDLEGTVFEVKLPLEQKTEDKV